jgi:hypothetical protein
VSAPEVEGWEVDWCRGLWDSLRDRGVWGIPRSGLIFEKREEAREFAVVARMPHEEGMLRFDGEPLTAAEFAVQQQAEVDGTRARFAVLGITVPESDREETEL